LKRRRNRTRAGEGELGAKRRAYYEISSDENHTCSYLRARCASLATAAIIITPHTNPFRFAHRSTPSKAVSKITKEEADRNIKEERAAIYVDVSEEPTSGEAFKRNIDKFRTAEEVREEEGRRGWGEGL